MNKKESLIASAAGLAQAPTHKLSQSLVYRAARFISDQLGA